MTGLTDLEGRDVIVGAPVEYWSDPSTRERLAYIPIVTAYGSRLAWILCDDLDVTPN